MVGHPFGRLRVSRQRGNLKPMMPISRCPFCAHERLQIVRTVHGFVVRCPECAAAGPLVESQTPEHAAFAWNQRQGDDSFAEGVDDDAVLLHDLLH